MSVEKRKEGRGIARSMRISREVKERMDWGEVCWIKKDILRVRC
jgi:hypothetical protein